jgi:hypothetical protein
VAQMREEMAAEAEVPRPRQKKATKPRSS